MNRAAIFEAIDHRRPFSFVAYNDDGTVRFVIPFNRAEMRRASATS
jgi:hypothetical protein